MALAGLGGESPELLLVFATADFDQHRLVEGVRAEAPAAQIAGCSGEGIISHGESREQEYAVAVMAVHSDSLEFISERISNYSEDPSARGAELAVQLKAQGVEDALGLLVFPDGLTGNCTAFLRALQAGLGDSMPLLGGTSADGMRFSQTHQYDRRGVSSDSISTVLIKGAGKLEFAVSHGCAPIGVERRITEASDGWVHRIDDRPAWSVFKEYLDGDPEDLDGEGIVHLCIGEQLTGPAAESYAPYVIRTPLQLDKQRGSLFFPGGSLESGQTIRLTRRDPDRIRESARQCAHRLTAEHGRSPSLVMQFDCAGRGQILFGQSVSNEIVTPLQEVIGPRTPWIGFHTYGEIAPIENVAYYHNYSVVLCALFDEI